MQTTSLLPHLLNKFHSLSKVSSPLPFPFSRIHSLTNQLENWIEQLKQQSHPNLQNTPPNLPTQKDATAAKAIKTPYSSPFQFLQSHSPIIPMMPTSASVNLKSKLLKPFKKLLHVFKFKLKRPIFRPFSQFRKLRGTASQKTRPTKRIHRLLPFFRSSMKSEERDVVVELRSVPEAAQERALFPSPITPAYVRAGEGVSRREVASLNDVIEDSCRSFENYLVEMIVEEGKMKDLTDVEELLYCWKNLKCPVFHDLVCRFYGDLCRDLFSGDYKDEEIDGF